MDSSLKLKLKFQFLFEVGSNVRIASIAKGFKEMVVGPFVKRFFQGRLEVEIYYR